MMDQQLNVRLLLGLHGCFFGVLRAVRGMPCETAALKSQPPCMQYSPNTLACLKALAEHLPHQGVSATRLVQVRLVPKWLHRQENLEGTGEMAQTCLLHL